MRRIRQASVPRNPWKRETIRAMPRFFRQRECLAIPSSRKTVLAQNAASNIVRNVERVAIIQLYGLELLNTFSNVINVSSTASIEVGSLLIRHFPIELTCPIFAKYLDKNIPREKIFKLLRRNFFFFFYSMKK